MVPILYSHYKETTLNNFHTYSQGQSHAGSLVVVLVSMSFFEYRLFDSVGFLMVSLTSLAPKVLPPSVQQDYLSSV